MIYEENAGNGSDRFSETLRRFHLPGEEREWLKECYLQKNTVQSTAYKLRVPQRQVQVWYYRLSMALLEDRWLKR